MADQLLLGSAVTLCLLLAAMAEGEMPEVIYDESKVPAYTLPDPLVPASGERVTDAKTWRDKRRPEILKLFETNLRLRQAPARQP